MANHISPVLYYVFFLTLNSIDIVSVTRIMPTGTRHKTANEAHALTTTAEI